jgi:hypothetical protein
MLRNVFTKTLWDARRSLLSWAVAISAVAAMYAAFWPTVNTPQMQQALGNYPQGVLEAFNYNDLTSPAGYLGSSVYGLFIPLLVAVFAIAYGTRAVAGDEEAGTLELLLAHSVSRTRLALQRFAARTASLVLVGARGRLARLAIAARLSCRASPPPSSLLRPRSWSCSAPAWARWGSRSAPPPAVRRSPSVPAPGWRCSPTSPTASFRRSRGWSGPVMSRPGTGTWVANRSSTASRPATHCCCWR